MTMTVATAQTHLDAWLAANLAASRNQSYTIGDRTLSRADLGEIRKEIGIWQRTIQGLKAQAAGNSNPGVKVARWS